MGGAQARRTPNFLAMEAVEAALANDVPRVVWVALQAAAAAREAADRQFGNTSPRDVT